MRLETYRVVVETARDRWFDPTFGGVDWPAVGERYRPLVLATPKSAAGRMCANRRAAGCCPG